MGVPLNEWTFVAATYAPDGQRAHYINADHSEAAECSADANVPLRVTEHDFKFGARGRCYACTNVHGLFKGNLDDAMVFDRALQQADVAMLHDGDYRHAI